MRLHEGVVRRRSWNAGLLIVAFLMTATIFAPVIAPHNPAAVAPDHRLEGPSPRFPLGTDHLGRCVWSRLLYGARWSLGTAAVAAGLILAIGALVGTVSGYLGGVVDIILMRVVDVLLAFPALIPALAIVGMLGPGVGHLLAATVSVSWAGYARMVRGLVLSVRKRQFVESSRALGAPGATIITRHILPNVLPSVLVLASVDVGGLLLLMAGLSFLGLGVQPPTPEWGGMLNDGRTYLFSAPQLMIYPGIAISLAVIGFNLLGEGARDLLDPRLSRA